MKKNHRNIYENVLFSMCYVSDNLGVCVYFVRKRERQSEKERKTIIPLSNRQLEKQTNCESVSNFSLCMFFGFLVI